MLVDCVPRLLCLPLGHLPQLVRERDHEQRRADRVCVVELRGVRPVPTGLTARGCTPAATPAATAVAAAAATAVAAAAATAVAAAAATAVAAAARGRRRVPELVCERDEQPRHRHRLRLGAVRRLRPVLRC